MPGIVNAAYSDLLLMLALEDFVSLYQLKINFCVPLNVLDGFVVQNGDIFTIDAFAWSQSASENLSSLSSGQMQKILADNLSIKTSKLLVESIYYCYQKGTTLDTFYDKRESNNNNNKLYNFR